MPATVLRFAVGKKLPKSIYLDANIVIASAIKTDQYHDSVRKFFLEALKQKVALKVSTLTLDESWHHWIKGKHAVAGENYNPKTRAHNSKFHADVAEATSRLLALNGVELLTNLDSQPIVDRALAALRDQELATRDSFHLAHAVTRNIEGLATTDSDFDALNLPATEDLTVIRLA
jgi:predicted nucleic acid-binding protein